MRKTYFIILFAFILSVNVFGQPCDEMYAFDYFEEYENFSNPTYTISKGKSVNDEWIKHVKIGNINNETSADAGYGDFSHLSTEIESGSLQTIEIQAGWSGTFYQESYAVWIDYNQDGDFQDKGEQVASFGKSKQKFVVANFEVPENAKAGATRMRVAMKYPEMPKPNETFEYGEVEDYTVIITEKNNLLDNDELAPEISIYPNPATDFLKIKGIDENFSAEIFSAEGKIMTTNNDNIINTSTLPVGNYFLKIKTANNEYRFNFSKM